MKILGLVGKLVLVGGIGLGSALLTIKGFNWWLFGPQIPDLQEMDIIELIFAASLKGFVEAALEDRIEQWFLDNPEFAHEALRKKLDLFTHALRLEVVIKEVTLYN